MSAVLGAVGGAAAEKLLSRAADYIFTALDMGVERKQIFDAIRAKEDAGLSPEDALQELVSERKAAHQDLGDALK